MRLQVINKRIMKALRSLAPGLCMLVSVFAQALPENPVISVGEGSFSQPNDQTLSIEQNSQQIGINFESFNINTNETVNFIQPNPTAIALGRVTGGDVSQILGALNANGQVFLVNPNGVVFGETAKVNVGSLLVSTLDITHDDFVAGRYEFSMSADGRVVNYGDLNAADGGYIVLMANEVSNNGDISVVNGQANLVTADEVILSFVDGQPAISVQKDTYQGYIENKGLIYVQDGAVLLSANSEGSLYQTVINNQGSIEATGIVAENGRVFLTSGSEGDVINHGQVVADSGVLFEGDRVAHLGGIDVSSTDNANAGQVELLANDTIALGEASVINASVGTVGDGGEVIVFSQGQALFRAGAEISAQGGSDSGSGGFVEVSGIEKVEIAGTVDTSASNGESGLFYIDPTDITITNTDNNINNAGGVFTPTALGSTIDVGTLQTNLSTGNVRIETTSAESESGDITINSDINLDGSNGNELTLQADGSIAINANIQDQNTVTVDNTDISLIAGGNLTIADGNLVNATGGDIQLTVGGNANVTGLMTTSASSTAIIVNAATINDNGDTALDFNANNGGIQLGAGVGGVLDIETAVDHIDVTLSAPSTLSINEQDDISLGVLTNVVDLIVATSGTVAVADGGLNISNAISLSAADIVDSDRSISITTQDLQLNLVQVAGDVNLTSNVNRMDIQATAVGAQAFNFTVNSDNGIRVEDINSDGDSFVLTNGNLALIARNGDVSIQDNVIVTDSLADGIRQGLIDISMTDGDFLLGTSGAASLQSLNSVDQNVEGGLGSSPTNQVAIRVQHQSQQDQTFNYTLGDGVGNDVSIVTQGGDIYIDSFNDAQLGLGSTRLIQVNGDVSIAAYNNVVDAADGNVIAVDSINTVNVQANTGRTIEFRQDDTQSVTSPTIAIDIDNEIADAWEKDDKPNLLEIPNSIASDLSQLFSSELNHCQQVLRSNYETDQQIDCEKAWVLMEFLQGLLINGDLPDE